MTTTPELCVEAAGDEAAIEEVVTRAFGQTAEARLVATLRKNEGLTFSAVARVDGRVVGHVAYSPLSLGGLAVDPPVLALAPVAVLPDMQRQGIGSKLVRWSLEELRRRMIPGVIVLGEPEFYGRFGFVAATAFSIRCPFEVPAGYFMALELQPGGFQGGGLVGYRPEFGVVC